MNMILNRQDARNARVRVFKFKIFFLATLASWR